VTRQNRHSLSLRVPPRYCDAQGMLHAVRYYELFEEAFLSWLDHTCGGYLALQATGGDLVIAENGCSYRHPAWQNEQVTIEVYPVRKGRSSFCMAFDVRRDECELAEGRAVYIYVKNESSAQIPALLEPALTAVRARSHSPGPHRLLSDEAVSEA
jgi:acyl-CoA thioester hydrolase